MTVNFEASQCPLCCQSGDTLVLEGRDILHGLPGEFRVLKCQCCGLMRTDPRPTPEAIGFYYPADYGPYVDTQIQLAPADSSLVRRFKDALRPLTARLFDTKAHAVPKLPPGRMLEIGCASGAFLDHMAKRGWHVEGVEFSEAAASAARSLGYPVHTGPLEDAPAPSLPVDLVVGWMVLEHLHDPIGCLAKLNEWSSANAWLVLSVPNAKSAEFSVFRENWYALQLPTHLHHFTPKSLTHLLGAAGWKLEALHHQRSLGNLLFSLAYITERHGLQRTTSFLRRWAGGNGVRFYVLFPLAWLLSLFGQTGRMTVWARKHEQQAPIGTTAPSTRATTP